MFALYSLKLTPQQFDSSFELISKAAADTQTEFKEKEIEEKTNQELIQFTDAVNAQLHDGDQVQLQYMTSSLTPPLVAQLTNHLRRKLIGSGLQALAGTTDILDGSDSEKPEMCALFYHQDSHLVCLVDSNLQKLDAFHDQLIDYVRQQLAVFVESLSESSSLEAAAAAAFAAWEDATVAALQRTVKLLRNLLPQLLTLVFVGCEVSVECAAQAAADSADHQRQREVARFIGQCRLMDAMEAAAAAGTAGVAGSPFESQFPSSASLRISGRFVGLDFHYCTEFARNWSAALLDSVDDENPVRLQQRILDLKLQASRDVNAVKRLLAEAVTDYYALYRLVQALRLTGNAPVLLYNLRLLGQSPDEREVVSCASDFLAATCPLLATLTAGAATAAAAAAAPVTTAN